MNAVMDVERGFGFVVKDVGAEKCGWDVTSQPPANADGSIQTDRHIEVKAELKAKAPLLSAEMKSSTA